MTAEVLRLPVPNLRNEFLCNWDTATALALADWLERTAVDFADLVRSDAIDCPGCGEGCTGHPAALWCDRCGGPVESTDYPDATPCRCWTEALATARALAVSFGLVPAPAHCDHWVAGDGACCRCTEPNWCGDDGETPEALGRFRRRKVCTVPAAP